LGLIDWLQRGWLAEHRPNRREIKDLFAIADRDLAQSQTPGLSADWQLAIAYNALLQLALAALAVSGYRPAGEGHHYRAIQSLAFTLGTSANLVAQLDAFRKKRNAADYQRVGAVSTQEAKEILALAKTLRTEAAAWLKKEHPELL